ncbi:MAG: SDR family oxidoreductase [Alphaproteobacteria bacterium]
MSEKLLQGKKGLIMGVANDHSLAWGISSLAAAHGAELAFTYQTETLEKRVTPLAESVGSDLVLRCDVSNDAEMAATFDTIKKKWGKLDFLVHAIAFADRETLKGQYIATPRAAFLQALDVSCYSFTAACQHAAPLMTDGGSIITMTFQGSQRVIPHYNVMGVAKAALESSVRYLAVDLGGQNIRVNALCAGPARTLAASGIGDFHYMLKWNKYNAPLKRNITLDDVAGAGLYLLSNLSSGVTGEVHHVDAGYHVVGMKALDAPDIALVE